MKIFRWIVKKSIGWIVGVMTLGVCIRSCQIVWLSFVAQSYHIPTGSMFPTIMPGDRVLVNKLLFGPRVEWKGQFYRFPGLRPIQRGDILVFNFPVDKRRQKILYQPNYFYCKRCVGLPGDSVSVVGGYFRNTHQRGRIGYLRGQRMLANYADFNMSDSVKRVFPDAAVQWTIKDWGPVFVPKAGISWRVDSVSYSIYRLILDFETGEHTRFQQGKLIVGNDTMSSYTFTHNYYFCCGDNLVQSYDSRYWGFIPEEFIVGITQRIFYSRCSNLNSENRRRFLKPLY